MKAMSLNREKVLKFLSDFENFSDIHAIVFGINAEDMSLEHIGFMFNVLVKPSFSSSDLNKGIPINVHTTNSPINTWIAPNHKGMSNTKYNSNITTTTTN